jgi:hypothetical protein
MVKHIYLDHYVDLEEAKQVATSMRDKYFKDFANHGSY